MAIDTALKRRSAGAVGRRVNGAGVTPNAAKPQAWRQAAAWAYAGILASAPIAIPHVVANQVDIVLPYEQAIIARDTADLVLEETLILL